MSSLSIIKNLTRYETNGYYQYYIPDHHLASKSGLVYEHQLAAEEKLCRELHPGEVVHHIDRNRKNNDLNNLMIFKTSADHAAYHAGKEITQEGDVYIALGKKKYIKCKNKNGNISTKDKCPYCGQLKDIGAEKCFECRKKEQAKNIPSKDELKQYLKDKSMCAIGRIYHVSDNAVRKWCKKYGLPFSKKDIEEFRKKREPDVKIIKE